MGRGLDYLDLPKILQPDISLVLAMNLEIRNEIVKLCVIEFAFLNHNTSFKEPWWLRV